MFWFIFVSSLSLISFCLIFPSSTVSLLYFNNFSNFCLFVALSLSLFSVLLLRASAYDAARACCFAYLCFWQSLNAAMCFSLQGSFWAVQSLIWWHPPNCGHLCALSLFAAMWPCAWHLKQCTIFSCCFDGTHMIFCGHISTTFMVVFLSWFSSLVRSLTSLVSCFVARFLTLKMFSDLVPCSIKCSSIVLRLTSSEIFVNTKHGVNIFIGFCCFRVYF